MKTDNRKCTKCRLRDSFTTQGKIAWKHNSKIEAMGMNISAGDLLPTRKLKNT